MAEPSDALRRENGLLRAQLAPGGQLAQQLEAASDAIQELIREKDHNEAENVQLRGRCDRLTSQVASMAGDAETAGGGGGAGAPRLALGALPAAAKRLDELEYELGTHKAGRDEAVAARAELQRRNVELRITVGHLETEVDMLRRAGPGSVHSVPMARTSSPAGSAAGMAAAGNPAREMELTAMLEEVLGDLERKEAERAHWQGRAVLGENRAVVAEHGLLEAQKMVVGAPA